MVNLLTFFRVSLFESIFHRHTHPGFANYAVDYFIGGVLEFKAFELFSLTFGMGVAVQFERASQRSVHPELFLLRRFFFLLAFGIAHMTLVSNVDILALYAICGFCLTALLRLPTLVLAFLGLASIYLPSVLPVNSFMPSEAVMRAQGAAATLAYSHGNFYNLLLFRWAETRTLIFPLLLGVAQRSFGLMLLGISLWRAGVVREPERFRSRLWAVCVIFGILGIINTVAEMRDLTLPRLVSLAGSNIPLAFAYGAAIIAWNRSGRAAARLAPVAAAGQMALTNYLTQTILFSFLFFGYGFGLMGRLSPLQAAGIGFVLYAAQLWFSRWWLRRYRFGPFEWLWRSATYGRLQPL